MIKQTVILVDLPVFPKGSISLSLPAVASVLSSYYEIEIFDLNIIDVNTFFSQIDKNKSIAFFGLKVSCQNIKNAISLASEIRQNFPKTTLIWGGELPTLLPEKCLEFTDSIVQGLWEPIAHSLIGDLQNEQLKTIYTGDNKFSLTDMLPPRFDLIKDPSRYHSFMGIPLETSRGCTEVCSFCMVHVMQKKNYFVKSSARWSVS